MGRGREEPLVRVASVGNQAIAEMWRELLRNNGIPALVRIDGPLTGYATFASPHDLLVLAPDLPAARDLLAAYDQGVGEDEDDRAPGRDEASDDEGEEPYWMAGAEGEEPG